MFLPVDSLGKDESSIDLDVGPFGGSESGSALSLGAGYDIGFGGSFGLTPFVNLMGGNFDGGSLNLFQAGLGFNWY